MTDIFHQSSGFSFCYITHLPSHNNIAQPPSSQTLAAFSIHTTSFQAFLRQLSRGKSGHWFDNPYSRNRVRMYEGNIGGCNNKNSSSLLLLANLLSSDLHCQRGISLRLIPSRPTNFRFCKLAPGDAALEPKKEYLKMINLIARPISGFRSLVQSTYISSTSIQSKTDCIP